LGAALFSALAAVLQAQEPPSPTQGIIPRLSVEAYNQAKACGRAGAECATTPYLVCPSLAAQYSIRLATPFSRVASAVLENIKSGKPGRGMDRGNANQWGTGVYVLPAEHSSTAAGIERMEIRRQGQTIQPLTTTVGPISVPGADGSSRPLTRGYFAFDASAFEPSADITLSFVGTSSETVTCEIERRTLQNLR
jgi:hypothetical protein